MVREIDRFEVQRLLRRGAQLVDVLPDWEYEQEHIAGAVNLPLDELGAGVARSRLDAGRPVITYCCNSMCDRSGRAAARLRTLGFSDVYNYQPGKIDWLSNGLPIEGRHADRLQLGDIARADVPTCHPDETIAEVRERVGDWDVCPVVDQDDVLLGLLHAEALAKEGHHQVAELMQEAPVTYRPAVPVERAAELVRDNPEPLVIVSNADGVMVGIADQAAIRRLANRRTA
jgi:rhodanese-related sulfurtransferase/CBS domain-containing protein